MLDHSNILTIRLIVGIYFNALLRIILLCYKNCYCNDYATIINSEFTSIGFINGITKYPFHYVYHIEDSFIVIIRFRR